MEKRLKIKYMLIGAFKGLLTAIAVSVPLCGVLVALFGMNLGSAIWLALFLSGLWILIF